MVLRFSLTATQAAQALCIWQHEHAHAGAPNVHKAAWAGPSSAARAAAFKGSISERSMPQAVMGIDGVDGLRTVTNHVTETNEVLVRPTPGNRS